MIYRNPKLLADAKGRSCIACGADDGTIVAAHYCGIKQQSLGKGMGIKPHDLCADLCASCHRCFDLYVDKNTYERGFHFLMYILQSQARRLNEGWEFKKR